MIYDVLIVGAGAAGLYAAANLKAYNVAIIEKNIIAGKKIIASGGGRCNITNRNISAKNYFGNADFVTDMLTNLKYIDVLGFFEELKFIEQKDSQFFCATSSRDVLSVLLRRCKHNGVQIFYDCELISAVKNSEVFEITTNLANFKAKNLVIATGGVSYKSLGVSDVALNVARDFGLNFIPFVPALVGFSVQKDEFWFKNLSGISLKAKISVAVGYEMVACEAINEVTMQKLKGVKKYQKIYREFNGDVLFTHRGISGPAVLNASLFWQKGRISINFVPNFNQSNLKNTKKQISSILPLPRRFTLEFLNAFNISDKPFDKCSHSEKEQVLKLLNYEFAPAGTFGFERAEVSRGGVSIDELSSSFESKKVKNLYFIGECVDITGMLGGYNLHFAFASATAAVKALNLKS
ncbi:NAD(P)/FAD-dependent oxidoreductase [Campylobacter sp. faydin G-140]|uniref:NAD(P)/FAD-dependent oxidoreductase n=1 Tax=Campylobacter anatolicus TaxID=2829105 RepID=UPI001B938246|nr:NAD(P)/FAD-dependent oxidoreductase [Campylobacter anatolicus]